MAKVTQSKATSGPATPTDIERVVIEDDNKKKQDPIMVENPFLSTYQDVLGQQFTDINDLILNIAGERPEEADVYTEDMKSVLASLREQEKGMDPSVKRSLIESQRQDLASAARAGGAATGLKGKSIENRSMQDRYGSLLDQAKAVQQINDQEQEAKDLASKQLLDLDTQLAMRLKDKQDEYDRYRQELFARFSNIISVQKTEVQ